MLQLYISSCAIFALPWNLLAIFNLFFGINFKISDDINLSAIIISAFFIFLYAAIVNKFGSPGPAPINAIFPFLLLLNR